MKSHNEGGISYPCLHQGRVFAAVFCLGLVDQQRCLVVRRRDLENETRRKNGQKADIRKSPDFNPLVELDTGVS